MSGKAVFLPAFIWLAVCAAGQAHAQTSGEEGRICEATPVMRCLDKEQIEGETLRVPEDYAAIAKDGFAICDSSFNYVAAPDIVLIMDNTSSMQKVQVVDGIPRWCEYPDAEISDPGCISGDPDRLRGPALQSFLDSALVKGGKGINVGVVTFSETAESKSEKLVPLTEQTLGGIKSTIVMNEMGGTNYTEAFIAARRLLESSRKPKKQQYIIFVSDGRPNYPRQPDGDPYSYKGFWDSLPTVHSIFLGDNKANYKDMQDVSDHTNGRFFNISDVRLLAKLLTDDLAETLFSRASPILTLVRNQTIPILFQIDADKHVLKADSGAYVLQMPGPLYLQKGINDIVIKTEYENSGTTQDVHFKIERSAEGPYFAGLEAVCRRLPILKILNGSGVILNQMHLPYTIADSAMQYELTTAADLDSFVVTAATRSPNTAQQDLEPVPNGAGNRRDSIWTGSKTFEHQVVRKTAGDGLLQVEHGETLIVSYHNPFIREDSVQAQVRIKYGPEFDKAAYRDLDKDGRIETVTIRFLDPLPEVPEKLRFNIKDAAGISAERIATAAKGEIRFDGDDGKSLTVTLANPFPFGMTSVMNPDSSGHTYRQLDIPMIDGAFRVDDSVPPVIVSAQAVIDKASGKLNVQVTYSEPITLSEPFLQPLVFKRDTVVFSSADIPISGFEKKGDRNYVFTIGADADFKPVGGDHIAINNNGETRDLSGTAPTGLVFTSLGGAAPGQAISDFYVTFANGSKSDAQGASEPLGKDVVFIPVDSKGYPLPGSTGGKCGDCTASRDDVFTGSVIVIATKQPVTYRFTIFTNLGQAVARGTGKVEADDLPLLDKREDANGDPNQTEYVQRIVWTGRSETGHMAGTGAYVLKADFTFDRNFKTGAKATRSTKFSKFGFLRACCEAYNRRWYE